MNDATLAAKRELGFSLLGKKVYAPTAEDEPLTGPWVVSVLHENGLVQLSCPHCEWGSGGSYNPEMLVLVPADQARRPGETISDDRLAALVDRPSARVQLGRELAGDSAGANQELAGMANELLAHRARYRQRHGGPVPFVAGAAVPNDELGPFGRAD